MEKRTGVIRFNGNPLTLLGPEIKAGDKAPDFQVVDGALKTVTLADFRGKTKIICAVPSLDTPVCDTQTRRFNQEATQLGDDFVVLTISLDLPFAQQRWCAGAGVEHDAGPRRPDQDRAGAPGQRRNAGARAQNGDGKFIFFGILRHGGVCFQIWR